MRIRRLQNQVGLVIEGAKVVIADNEKSNTYECSY